MQLSDAVVRRFGATETVRYGVVSTVDVDTLTLAIGGESVEGVPWIESYPPVQGERVAVLRSPSGWLILGAVTSVGATYNEPVTVEVAPEVRWVRGRNHSSESWDGYYDPYPDGPVVWDGQQETIYDPPLPWEAANPASITDPREILAALGMARAQQGDSSLVNYTSPMRETWSAFWYPNPASAIPTGAVVTSISFSVRNDGPRIAPVQGEPDLWVQGHAMTSSQVLAVGGTAPFPVAPGYADWNAGRVPAGRVGTFTLPPTWAAALLAGTLTGLALVGPDTSGMYISEQRDANFNVVSNVRNLTLRITYMTPVVAAP